MIITHTGACCLPPVLLISLSMQLPSCTNIELEFLKLRIIFNQHTKFYFSRNTNTQQTGFCFCFTNRKSEIKLTGIIQYFFALDKQLADHLSIYANFRNIYTIYSSEQLSFAFKQKRINVCLYKVCVNTWPFDINVECSKSTSFY